MIVEKLIDIIVAIVAGIINLLPDLEPPNWLTSNNGAMATMMGWFSGLGAWVPLSLVLTVAAAVLACMVVGFTIKIIRIIASFLTAGGGSAA